MTVEEDVSIVLGALAELERGVEPDGDELSKPTGMSADRLNDAVQVLEDSGYLNVLRTLGTAPYDFRSVEITSAGRMAWERASAEAESSSAQSAEPKVRQTPYPVGSPYGFRPEDWEFIELERGSKKLVIAFGHQFKSDYYDSNKLGDALRSQFEEALEASQRGSEPVLELEFVLLRAGYGEHQFNQIARSIIASDIAVFETSDRNPNVMIEMGVALTWGTRVHPIRHADAPEPPSDISGQTWARYKDDGASWEDTRHFDSLVAMVKLAFRRKMAYQ